MDLDALTRAAKMLSPEVVERDLVDDLPTVEQEFDDMQPMPEGETTSRPRRAMQEGSESEEPGETEEPGEYTVLDDEAIAQMLRQEIDSAMTDLETENGGRDTAMNYYFGHLPAQSAKGRSSVVSKDVADMVEAMLAQVLQAFSGQEIAHFPPNNEEDEQQAEEESSYCNWVFFEDCRGGHLLYNTLKDAMQRALCVGKVYWDKRTKITFDEYHNLTPEEIQQALQPQDNEQIEVVGYEPGDTVVLPPDPQVVMAAQQRGMPPPQPQQVETYSIRVKRKRTEEKPKIVEVDCADFIWNSQHSSLFLDDVRFCGERRILTQSQLIDMGLDEDAVESLKTYTGTSQFATSGKQRDKHGTEGIDELPSDNRAARPIEVFECYYLVDRDGDGYAERVKAFYSDGRIIPTADGEGVVECDTVPYALGCPFPTPHKVIGESVFDKIKQVQDTKTALLRIAIDNALINTFGRYEAEERMVNMNDLLTPVPGGAVRSRKIGSVAPLAMANVGDAPMNLMNYMDKVRTEGAGPALDMQKENLPVNVQTAHGTERVMSAMEQLVSRMANSFADTYVSELFRLLHDLLMKHGKGELTARMPNGKFLVTDPRNWRERERVTISIGKTQGERNRMAAALTQTLGNQMQLFQAGGDGILVTLPKIHNTLVDLGRAYNLPSPDQYWVDPSSPEAQQAAQQKQQAAQQAAMQQQQQMQMLLNLQVQMQQMQEDTKRMKAEIDAQAKAAELMQKGVQHAEDNALKLTELEITSAQQADAEYNQNLRAMSQQAQPRRQ